AHDELEVARQAVQLARRPHNPQAGQRDMAVQAHCGFYLIGPGRQELQATLGFRPRLKDRFLDLVLAPPLAFYFGTLATVGAAILTGIVAYAAAALPNLGTDSAALLLLVLLCALLPVSELALGLVHYLVTLLLPPRVLAKMDFKEGIPADCATF